MEKFKLKLEARENRKPNQLRLVGKIPATVYGPGVESKAVQVDKKEFSKLPAAAYSHIIDLAEPKEGNISAIIRHVQRKYTNSEVLNIEFYRVAADRKLTVTVPLKLVGTSLAITMGGLLNESYQEAEVECLPADIPDFLEVDISQIKEIDQGIHFSDLKVPGSVKILNPHDEIIVRVVAPRVVVEEAGAPAAAAEGAAPAADKAAAPAADKDKAAAPAKK